tara:strand:- start:85 stop:1329 length:1245 start_codon:yes stop_codon:yes gene_type:complete
MKIWLINPYGPIPTEKWRDYSFSIFGQHLASQGHDVIWWTSNYSHHFKKYRSNGFKDIEVTDGFIVRLIPTTSYKKNIGIGRIFRDLIFSLQVNLHARKEMKPDIILYFESPLSLGLGAPALSKHHKCALIYDQMDLWPELMIRSSPVYMRRILSLFLAPVYWKRKRIFKNLDGVVALAQPYLDAVVKVEPRVKEKPNTVIYNGINVADFRQVMAEPISSDINIPAERGKITIIFAGSLGPSYDVSAILKVAEVTCMENLPISVFIAGDGPLRTAVETAASDLPCLHYFGQLAPSDLCSLYSICDIGLVAYGQTSNVEMPDKFYDYTAAGLALVNSLQGEVQSLIDEYELGLTYKAGDAEDLLLAIQRFIGDEEALSRCKENSFNCAENFCSTLQNDKLDVFLSEVITSFKNSK